MKPLKPLAFHFATREQTLEASLLAATTLVVTGGIVAMFVRLALA